MIVKRLIGVGLLVAAITATTASAGAAVPVAPAWDITSVAAPTNFKPGDKKGDYFYEVITSNIGGAPTDGSTLTITDTLPAGLTVKSIDLFLPETSGEGSYPSACTKEVSGEVTTVTCTITEAIVGADEPATVGPSEHLTLLIHVTTPITLLGSLKNFAEVSGGGAPAAASESENEATEELAAAGLSLWRARVTDGEGHPVLGAGSHPFQIITSFAVNTNPAPAGSAALFLPAQGDVKNIEVALPPGLVGNPTVATRCTPQQFTTVHQVSKGGGNIFINDCPDSSAIGTVSLRQIEGHVGEVGLGGGPIYNLEPPKGMPAQFGFQAAGAPFYIDVNVRSGSDYGVTATLQNTSEAKRVSAASVTIWGVPAEDSHDGMRGECAEAGGSCDAELEPRPFLRMPTSCGSPLPLFMSFDIWTDPGSFISQESVQPAVTECELPDFSPEIEVQPTTTVADSPTGLHLDVHLPQVAHEEDPEGLGEADLRDITVALPPGLLVNPASADGLASCSPAQIGFLGFEGASPRFTPDPPQCPDGSKIGTVEVETPLVDHPLPGAVYLAKQEDNPFGSLIAIYVTVADPQSGVVVKLPSKVTPDPSTGRLTATVTNSPQTPFEDFKLDFFSGPRASLRTPASCGIYSTTADLVPWTAPAGAAASRSDSFEVASGPGGGCPSGALAPHLSAGLGDPTAGSFSPFTMRISRDDATGEFQAVTATPPPGLLAKLKGVPYCPENAIAQATSRTAPGQGTAEAGAPSCPAASRVGSTTAGAGAGPNPFRVSGNVYLAGPYRGAPISLVAVVPALAGPFDLGVVTDRVALRVDSETAQVKAESDPFPTILSGIPLDVREIEIALDRTNFTVAPTNCEPMAVSVQVSSPSGATAMASDRFQVGGCQSLRFAPALKLKLKGGTKRNSNPALKAELRAKPGEANIGRTSVAMPHAVFLDQEHIGTICTRVQFAADACPKRSVYGKARAITPLLAKPLEGPVYLRSSNHQLPDLVAALEGQIDVDLVGRIDSHKGGIRTTFDTVPDAPVSKFVLEMAGGKKSLLVYSINICHGKHRATVKMSGQNGKRHDFRPLLQADCRKGKGKKRR